MKFDAIVGNPPYQEMDGGNNASAVPLYQLFMEQAILVEPHYISMIMPARWYSGGRGLDKFRSEMLNDERLSKMMDFSDSNDCFPGVDIAGGVCYFLWDKSAHGECKVISVHNGKQSISERKLNEYDTFIRFKEAISIIKKIQLRESKFYSERVSSQKPFGLRTYVKPTESGDIKLRYSGGIGPFNRADVTSGLDWIDKWKVTMSYLTYDHAGRPDKNGQRRIFSTMDILPPETVCTETYIVIDCFNTEQEAKNLMAYLKTRFVRFLVAQLAATQHLSKATFGFVPVQDFTEEWTDEKLYKKYELTEDEIAFIESTIRVME